MTQKMYDYLLLILNSQVYRHKESLIQHVVEMAQTQSEHYEKVDPEQLVVAIRMRDEFVATYELQVTPIVEEGS